MARPITTPVYFNGGALIDDRKTFEGLPLKEVIFLTVSAIENTRYEISTLETYIILKERIGLDTDFDGCKITFSETSEITPEGDEAEPELFEFTTPLPARGYEIVDWSQAPSYPYASLTFIIGVYSAGKKKILRKLSEVTSGEITPSSFKFLQVEMTNLLLRGGF